MSCKNYFNIILQTMPISPKGLLMCFVQKQILHFLIVRKKMDHPISTRDDGDYCTEEEILLAYFVCFILSVLHFDCHQLEEEIDGSDPPPPFLHLRLIPFHFPTRSRFVSVQSKLLFRTTSAETINSENIRTLKSHDP
jgi:hypothetical protein